MTTNNDRLKNLSPIKRAYFELSRALNRIQQLEANQHEEIAIVGIGCRFPGGANSPEDYWNLLEQGRDAITAIPPERWDANAVFGAPGAPGKSYVKEGGFLNVPIDAFDAEYFGISPREAERLDPQQRLLLEVAVEAVEDAGIPLPDLRDSRTGVFMGIMNQDFLMLQAAHGNPDIYTMHSGTGGAFSVAAGRLSFVLGLKGPNFPIDTACSSSLVAVHEACKSLRNRECDTALAGGVNVFISPDSFIMRCQAGMLSKDARCKTFDESANGYVPGEGCGIIVLKRLSVAISNKDRIYGIIKGSAINHDGSSSGITVPNGAAQQQLIREALRDARLPPEGIDFVECHGTGTSLGDPIEVGSLAAVFGNNPARKNPLVLGAAKTNIGHLESAAGVAGIIKTLLCLKHAKIPANLHLKSPNPNLPLDRLNALLPTQPVPWPRNDAPRRAGISSFGFSGTNAHIIIEEFREPASEAETETPAVVILSARSEESIKLYARSLSDYMKSQPNPGLRDLAYTLGRRRVHWGRRLAIGAKSISDLTHQLQEISEGESANYQVVDARPGKKPRLVFAFSGQGSQWAGMADGLLENNPVFFTTVEQIDALLKPLTGWSLLEELKKPPEASRLDETVVAQPAIFAIQAGLVAVLRAHGVAPQAVVGHSVGEIAAAWSAGALSLSDAVKVVYHRSRLMQRATGTGKMAAVGITEAEGLALLKTVGTTGSVAVAAINSPGSIVLSGAEADLQRTLDALPETTFKRMLAVDYAFHSPQMEPFRAELLAALSELSCSPLSTTLASTVTGDLFPAGVQRNPLNGNYWAENMCGAVRFADAIENLVKDDYDLFLEIGPHSVLSVPLRQCIESQESSAAVVQTLRRGGNPLADARLATGTLYAHGVSVDLSQLIPEGQVISAPPYAWRKKRFWLDELRASDSPRRGRRSNRPLLGESLDVAKNPNEKIWEMDISVSDLPYLEDHKIGGAVVVPGTAYLEMAAAAGSQYFGRNVRLESIALKSAMIISRDASKRVQVSLVRDNRTSATFKIHSATVGSASWTLHVTGVIRSDVATPDRKFEEAEAIQQRLTPLSAQEFYDGVLELGNDYGPTFRSIAALWRSSNEVFCRLEAPESLQTALNSYIFHPALFDASLHAFIAPIAFNPHGESLKSAFMPVHLQSVAIYRNSVGATLWSHIRIKKREKAAVLCDIEIRDEEGLVAEVLNGEVRLLELDREPDAQSWLHEVTWQIQPRSPLSTASRKQPSRLLIVCGKESSASAAVQKACRALAVEAEVIAIADALSQKNSDSDSNERKTTFVSDLAIRLKKGEINSIVYFDWPESSPASLLPGASATARQFEAWSASVRLMQALATLDPDRPPRLWIATRGAAPVRNSEDVTDPFQSPFWGSGRTFAAENSTLWGGLIDLDPHASESTSATELVTELAAPDGEDQIAYREGVRYAARLNKIQKTPGDMPFAFQNTGAYLITGGLGALGLLTAAWMVRSGARRLVLMGRTPLPPRNMWNSIKESEPDYGRISAIRTMEGLGASIHIIQGDVGNVSSLTTALSEYESENWPPIRGIVHAAGISHAALLQDLNLADAEREFSSKITGSWLLHQKFADQDLEFMIYYSSASVLLSSPQLGSYAAANAFMDALAHYRRSLKLPALSVNWGFWADAGMAVNASSSGNIAPKGMQAFTPSEAFEKLETLLTINPAQAAVMPFSLKEWVKYYSSSASNPFFSLLAADVVDESAASVSDSHSDAISQLKIMPESDRAKFMQRLLKEQISAVLKSSPEDVDPERSVGEMGLDSLMTLELRNRLQKSLATSLSATVFFNYPTVEALVPFLLGKLKIATATSPSEPSAATKPEIENRTQTSKVGARVKNDVLNIESTVETMTEDEAESMLLDELSKFE